LVGAAVFLASDAASFVTGHLLAVDGRFLASGVNQWKPVRPTSREPGAMTISQLRKALPMASLALLAAFSSRCSLCYTQARLSRRSKRLRRCAPGFWSFVISPMCMDLVAVEHDRSSDRSGTD